MKNKVELSFDSSNVECNFFLDDTDDILTVEVSGRCRTKSEGGIDIAKIIFYTSAYYIYFMPISIIFDLSNFEYTHSNSIGKLLYFQNTINEKLENQVRTAYILSEKNEDGILSFLQTQVLPKNYFFEYSKAIIFLKS